MDESNRDAMDSLAFGDPKLGDRVIDYLVGISAEERATLQIVTLAAAVYNCHIIDRVIKRAVKNNSLYETLKDPGLQWTIEVTTPFTSYDESIRLLKGTCDFCPEFYDIVCKNKSK